MDRPAIKDLLYGGILELMKNREYYYSSSVGYNYNHWTERGREVLADYMNLVSHKMMEAEHLELDRRAKQMVIDGLKDPK